ncbi:glycerol-3-phosphate dehydrogenase C-terminal domain-containing protein, partial [Phycicoccus flavus]
ETIRADPSMGEDVMGSADYLRAEIYQAAEHEMVVTMEDFMRRRSKIDLVVRDHHQVDSDGMREVARILFGDDADRRLEDYLATKRSRQEQATA